MKSSYACSKAVETRDKYKCKILTTFPRLQVAAGQISGSEEKKSEPKRSTVRHIHAQVFFCFCLQNGVVFRRKDYQSSPGGRS